MLIKSKIQQYYISKRVILMFNNILIIENENMIKIEFIKNQIITKSDIINIRKLILNKIYTKYTFNKKYEKKREKMKEKKKKEVR
jgi:hypothetical protein